MYPFLQVRSTFYILRVDSRIMPIAEGETVPAVVFKARVRDESIGGPNPFTWKDVSTADLFSGKRVVLFALPGGEE